MDSEPVEIPEAAQEKLLSLTSELDYRKMEDDCRWLINEFNLASDGNLARQMRMALPPVVSQELDRQLTVIIEAMADVDG